jgi:hypothetical protein
VCRRSWRRTPSSPAAVRTASQVRFTSERGRPFLPGNRESIRKATGVTVPLPDDPGAVTGALMNAVLLRKGRSRQLAFDFGLPSDAAAVETRWRDAEEGEKRSRARFAQNALKPEEVAPEWQRWRDLLGGPEQVRRFTERAMSRLDAPLQPVKANLFKAHLDALPGALKERLAARGPEGSVRLAFGEPPPSGAEMVTRGHALPATLAEALLEGALEPQFSVVPPLGEAARVLLEQQASGSLAPIARERLLAQA